MNILRSRYPNGQILVLNLGSSSLKFSLIHSISLEKEKSGSITGIGSSEAVMEILPKESGHSTKKVFMNLNLQGAIQELIEWVNEGAIIAIGYRVVQGGPSHISPELVNETLLVDLEAYVYLAPNHLPDEIKLIRAFTHAYIDIPHFACFDTYFHKDMPARSKFYPLPEKYRKMGLLRYGFHGLSYESIFHQLQEEDINVANQKIIIAHLGSGSSMVAISNGTSEDTTMGISPMGGLVMATRPGDLDPGAILFMLKQDQLSVQQLDVILSNESGLKAIAGTIDMKSILENRNKDQKSGEALDLFCYQAKKQIGSLAASLGGIDCLVFCGGIGENSALVREIICADMEFIGITLNLPSNANNDRIISGSNSKVVVKVMKTDEQLMIAMHIKNILLI